MNMQAVCSEGQEKDMLLYIMQFDLIQEQYYHIYPNTIHPQIRYAPQCLLCF